MAKSSHRLDLMIHFLLGTTLILKGYDKFSHHNLLGSVIFLFGIIVLGYFVFMIVKKQGSRMMHIVIHLFEAVVSLFIAYIFFEEGKKYVQYGFILAAIGFIIAAIVTSRNRIGHH